MTFRERPSGDGVRRRQSRSPPVPGALPLAGPADKASLSDETTGVRGSAAAFMTVFAFVTGTVVNLLIYGA